MKTNHFIFFMMLLVGPVYASHCQLQAERAAKAIARLNGDIRQVGELTTILSGGREKNLSYKTVFTYQSSDGSSTVEFTSKVYEVKTKGTSNSCLIKQVTQSDEE